MKISDLAINTALIEQPQWFDGMADMGDLRICVRGLGNAAYSRRERALIDALPRRQARGGRYDPAEVDRIVGTCLAETVIVDWQNLNDDEGNAIPFSVERATSLLTDPALTHFRNAVSTAAASIDTAADPILSARAAEG